MKAEAQWPMRLCSCFRGYLCVGRTARGSLKDSRGDCWRVTLFLKWGANRLNKQACPSRDPAIDGLQVGGAGLEGTELRKSLQLITGLHSQGRAQPWLAQLPFLPFSSYITFLLKLVCFELLSFEVIINQTFLFKR